MKRFIFGVLVGLLLAFLISSHTLPLPTLFSNENSQSISVKQLLQPPVPPDQSVNEISCIYGLSIGDSTNVVTKVLGEPDRKEKSAYGYIWWIYNRSLTDYVQVGVKDNRVVTIYSNAPTWTYQRVAVGTPITDVKKLFSLEPVVVFSYDDVKYSFNVSESFDGEKYLIIEDDLAVEIYVDKHANDTVSSIRFSDLQTLLTIGGYSVSMSYYGNPPANKAPVLSQADQESVDRANELQIFDLVNVVRLRNGLPILQWHEQAANVARSHTTDMLEAQFFSHVSPRNGQLSDRFEKAAIPYRLIGENIAYGQRDAIDVHEGWLNSIGHRENVLHETFQLLGVGASKTHYTQNFLTQ